MQTNLLTHDDLAARWKRSRRQVYNIINRHGLRAVMLDRKPLYRERDVERLESRLLA